MYRTIVLALRERFMQPSFALARQIVAIVLDAAEGQALDIEAFTAVLDHYGSDGQTSTLMS